MAQHIDELSCAVIWIPDPCSKQCHNYLIGRDRGRRHRQAYFEYGVKTGAGNSYSWLYVELSSGSGKE